MHLNLTESMLTRFWDKVQIADEDECWLWIGGVDAKKGKKYYYGAFRVTSRNKWRSHRFSYYIHNGSFDTSLEVMHICDNTLCVNPKHLQLGTHEDNMKDMAMKKRAVTHKGSKNGSSKLTEDLVKKIRITYNAGNYTQAELAEKHGVSQGLIGSICRRVSWKHVE